MFEDMLNDKITLAKSDQTTVIENIKANVSPGIITIFDEKLPIEEGDTILRTLPNGFTEKYHVTDRGFVAGMQGIPSHYQVKVTKQGTLNQADYKSVMNIYQASGTNARINVNSTDKSSNVVITQSNVFEELKKAIRSIQDEDKRIEGERLIQEMQTNASKPTFTEYYQKFIALLADHIGVFGPLLPALTQYLPR